MSGKAGFLDRAANVAAIATCVLVCSLAISRWFQQKEEQRTALSALPPVYPAGFVLQPMQNVDYAGSDVTVLLGLNSKCTFCTQSMPILREVSRRVALLGSQKARLVSIGTEPIAVIQSYLDAHGLSTTQTLSVTPSSALAAVATRTPSLVLVNRAGTVLESWPGLVTAERAEQLLKRVEEETRPKTH